MNKTLLMALVLLAVAAGIFFAWNAKQKRQWAQVDQQTQQTTAASSAASSSSPSSSSGAPSAPSPINAKTEFDALMISMNKALDYAVKASIPSARQALLVLPFTTPDNVITDDCYAVYLPALFKTGFSPEPLVTTPFYWDVMAGLNVRGLKKPGAVLTADHVASLSRALGCSNYAKGTLVSSNGGHTLTLEILWDGRRITLPPIVTPDDRLPDMPGLAAGAILSAVLDGKLPPAAKEFLTKPAAPDTATLRLAASMALAAAATSWNADLKSMAVLQHDSLDWFTAIRNRSIQNNVERIFQSATSAAQWRNNPFFQLMLADAYYLNKENARAADTAKGVVEKYPNIHHAWFIMLNVAATIRKPPAALEMNEQLLNSWPDSSMIRVHVARFRRNLAWHFRGRGFANTVTEEGWKKFEENLTVADSHLDAALARDPLNFHAWEERITVKKALGDDREFWNSFYKAVEVNRNYVSIYETMMNFVQPRWGGAETDLPKLWDWIMKESFENPYVYISVAYSIHDQARDYSWDDETNWPESKLMIKFLNRPGVWDKVETAFEHLLARIDNPNERAHYAYLLYEVGQREKALDHYNKTNHDITGTRIIPTESFYYSWAICALNLGHYDKCIEVCDTGIKKNLGTMDDGSPNSKFEKWRQIAQEKKNALVK